MAVTDLPTGPTPAPAKGVSGWFLNKLNRTAKLLEFLFAQRVIGFRVSETPEFEPECAPFFAERLAAAASYLEFGSGGSTILAAQAGKPLVSVESDVYFRAAVQRKLAALGCHDESRQDLIHADIGLTEAWGAPVVRRISPQRLARWRRYPEAPWAAFEKLPGPHLILIDGRFRVACALQAARFLHTHPGEVIFDDYHDREHYRIVERYLEPVADCGRMTRLKVRADLDVAALDADFERFISDFR